MPKRAPVIREVKGANGKVTHLTQIGSSSPTRRRRPAVPSPILDKAKLAAALYEAAAASGVTPSRFQDPTGMRVADPGTGDGGSINRFQPPRIGGTPSPTSLGARPEGDTIPYERDPAILAGGAAQPHLSPAELDKVLGRNGRKRGTFPKAIRT